MKRLYECSGCKVAHTVEEKGNLGAVFKETGMQPVMSVSGKIHWLCPACVEKAGHALKILKELFPEGDDYLEIHLPHLLKMKK